MTEIIRIPNIDHYTQEVVNGELVLTPKIMNILEKDLYDQTVIRHSVLISAVVGNVFIPAETEDSDDKGYEGEGEGNICSATNPTQYTFKSFRNLLIGLWKMMPTQKVLQNTTFNFKLTHEVGSKGYRWCEDIHMSFQSKDTVGTVKEIVHMVRLNGYTLDMLITLQYGNVVRFQLN